MFHTDPSFPIKCALEEDKGTKDEENGEQNNLKEGYLSDKDRIYFGVTSKIYLSSIFLKQF